MKGGGAKRTRAMKRVERTNTHHSDTAGRTFNTVEDIRHTLAHSEILLDDQNCKGTKRTCDAPVCTLQRFEHPLPHPLEVEMLC